MVSTAALAGVSATGFPRRAAGDCLRDWCGAAVQARLGAAAPAPFAVARRSAAAIRPWRCCEATGHEASAEFPSPGVEARRARLAQVETQSTRGRALSKMVGPLSAPVEDLASVAPPARMHYRSALATSGPSAATTAEGAPSRTRRALGLAPRVCARLECRGRRTRAASGRSRCRPSPPRIRPRTRWSARTRGRHHANDGRGSGVCESARPARRPSSHLRTRRRAGGESPRCRGGRAR